MINKIFQIGFNKCGTLSLWSVFNDYAIPSIKSIHWDNGNLAKSIYDNYCYGQPLLSTYDTYVYFGDMQYQLWQNKKPHKMILPYINMYPLLDKQYPDSKFILNTRNLDHWLLSRERWKPGFDNDFYMKAYDIPNIKQLKEFYEYQWHYHHKTVLEYFKDRPKDLLIFDIESDSIEKLKLFFADINFSDDLKSLPYLNRTI
jgi:hypothetical protein